ncbi:MAG: hypothetical protein JJU00_02625 [Opitutales bacterium]|nr:hypothetical protein [Opitutales bacterium]
MKYKTPILILASCLAAGPLFAAVQMIYDSTVSPISDNFDYIRDQEGFGFTFGAIATPTEAFGTSAGFRIFSLDPQRRADATIMLPEPATGGIRVSFRAKNERFFIVDSSHRKVSLRGANPKEDPDFLANVNTSSANYQNLLELITDGTVAGAWNRTDDGVGLPRLVVDPNAENEEFGVHQYDLVINASITQSLTYVIHGIERTLSPLRMDLFINGQVVTPASNPNGSVFENKAGFDPSLGFQYFSFTTATQSHEDTDFFFDQIYVYTGDDVNDGTEPSGPECPEAGLADNTHLGWLYHFGNCIAGWYGDASPHWGFIYTEAREAGAPGWFYHYGQGWIYVDSGSVGDVAFMYSDVHGWIAVSESFGADFYSYAAADFISWR